MSEYMEKHNVSRLIGAPPGYVGYEEGGQLTERIRHRPYAVVLLDEIEKAHPDVFNMLLQIMEEGHLTDSFGRRVDFSNVVLIMTSNYRSDLITDRGAIGFIKPMSEQSYLHMKTALTQAIEDSHSPFRPEMRNRLDEIIVFRPLGKKDLKKIVDLEFSKIAERAKQRDIALYLSPEAKELLINKGHSPEMGARPLRRLIEHQVEDKLAELIISGEFSEEEKTREFAHVCVVCGKREGSEESDIHLRRFTAEDLTWALEMEFAALRGALDDRGDVELTPEAKDWLVCTHSQPGKGAGPLHEAIETLKDRLVQELSRPPYSEGAALCIALADNQLRFRPMETDDLEWLLDDELALLGRRLSVSGVSLDVAPDARMYLMRKACVPKLDARPLRRAVEEEIEDPIAERITRRLIRPGQRVRVALQDGQLAFSTAEGAAPPGHTEAPVAART